MLNVFAPGSGLHRYTRIHLRHDRDAARAEVLRLEGVIRGLDTTVIEQGERIAQLEANTVDVSVERQLRLLAEEKAEGLQRQLLELKARVANEHAVTVPPAVRPVDPDEQPTEPCGINVRTLRDALNPSAA
ncbi:hypothetical protein [Streptomyces sp. SLBN-134]|uniref:hypothetical protein n=1 Tax=Streptomyces sp. SLBN-134 TaxID=2768456 RepID=UPI001150958A|nr:hypothetical protein [Streptomyces sp. SLBN-134]TQL21936.1 hypothetical protein FBY37_3952 [Streptomyces sp. SLBN-134]